MRQPLAKLSTSVAALGAVISLSAAVAAQPGGDVERAQALFTEGRAALEKGDHEAACVKFNQSLAIVQRASTLLNLAQCEEQGGKLVSALKHWRQGIAMLPAEDERLAVAQQRAAALAPRIPRLVVRVVAVAPPDARVELDGAPASLDDLLAGIAADPGRHLLVLHVAGRPDTRSEGTLVEGRTTTITLSPAAPTPPPVVPTGGGRLRTAGFAVLGVGVAGAVVAGVTGGILVARNSAINDECPFAGTVRKCSPHGRDLINGAGPLNIANGIGWGVGIAGVAAGIAMVVLGRSAPTSITPAPIGGGGGLFLTHVF